MHQELYRALQQALEELGVPNANFTVERPSDFSHGDYATNAALIAAKELGKNPKVVAQMLQEKLLEKFALKKVLGSPVPPQAAGGPDYFPYQISQGAIKNIEIAGPGFINFFLSQKALTLEVEKIATHELSLVSSDFNGQTVMIEFTDPNPFKEFHIGHLMSNTIGESIARILQIAGANVIRANYQGDVGLHVAKALWGKIQKPDMSWGEAYTFGSQSYDNNKEAIDVINKKVYDKSDPKINELYDEGKELSLAHFEEIYATLGTKFEQYFFESKTAEPGVQLVVSHIPDGIFEPSDGAIIFKGEKVGLHTRVFINSIGLPTYETKDLGLLFLKSQTARLDFSITITGNEQKDYFQVMLAAAKQVQEVEDIANKTMHISHGMMRFANEKMSSRTGNVITGESLLQNLKEISKAKSRNKGRSLTDEEIIFDEKKAEQVAVGAIKYAVLKQGKGKDIVFDPEKSLSLEGDSGPYLQYALVRLKSLLRNIEQAQPVEVMSATYDEDFQEAGSFFALQRLLIHFPEVVKHAAQELEPHLITTYVTELAALCNRWYGSERVVVDGRVLKDRIILIQALEKTLSKGLQLLGIPVPTEM